jgi:hypothetical protein
LRSRDGRIGQGVWDWLLREMVLTTVLLLCDMFPMRIDLRVSWWMMWYDWWLICGYVDMRIRRLDPWMERQVCTDMAVTLEKEALVVHNSLVFCFFFFFIRHYILKYEFRFLSLGSSSIEAALTLKSRRKTPTTQYIFMDREYSFKIDCRGMTVNLLKGQIKILWVIISWTSPINYSLVPTYPWSRSSVFQTSSDAWSLDEFKYSWVFYFVWIMAVSQIER